MIRKTECPVRETLWHVKLRNEAGETLYHWPTFIVAADTRNKPWPRSERHGPCHPFCENPGF